MGIYRGTGGTGDSTTDTTVTTVTAKAVEAAASATAAASSATSAATSATNAANAQAGADLSADAAGDSAVAAASSALTASGSAGLAVTSASNAATSETNAATSASNASTSETNAATSASNASTSESNAASSASAASTSATNAANSASAASTSATNAATSESNASTSASSAATSATSAATSATSAATSYDNFDDRYLGDKTANPTTDNDGDALLTGALYFNTTDNVMKVYDGSSWIAAYASLSGALLAENNLSDLANATNARTNLGVAIGTDVQAYSAILAGTTASFTTADETKLDGIETGATADQTAQEIATAIDADATAEATLKSALGLGTAAYTASTDYATAAQGTLADSAVQPSDNISTLTNDSGYITDVSNDTTPTLGGNLSTVGYNIFFGDNDFAYFGNSSDLQIYHDGSNSYIRELGTGDLNIRSDDLNLQSYSGENYLVADANGPVTLYHNNIAKVATTSVGIDVTGRVTADQLGTTGSPVPVYSDSLNDSAFSHRNLIYNGAMRIAQRTNGGAKTGISNNGYHVMDRWSINRGNLGASAEWAHDIVTDSPNGFEYSFEHHTTGAYATLNTDSYAYINQRFEGYDLTHLGYGTSDAKSLTVSFWVKCTETGTAVVNMYNPNSTQARVISKTYTINTANTWEYKTLTFPGDTSSAFASIDNTWAMTLAFILTAGSDYQGGSNDSWQDYTAPAGTGTGSYAEGQTIDLFDATGDKIWLTGVQMEVGEVATPFEHISYTDDLTRCRRYCQLVTKDTTSGDATDNRIYGNLYGGSAGSSFIFQPFVPTMRDTPDLSYGVAGGNGFSEVYTSSNQLGLYDNDDPTCRVYNLIAEAEL